MMRILAIALTVSPTIALAQNCEQLTSLKLPHVSITLAQPIASGAFTPPAPGSSDKSISAMMCETRDRLSFSSLAMSSWRKPCRSSSAMRWLARASKPT